MYMTIVVLSIHKPNEMRTKSINCWRLNDEPYDDLPFHSFYGILRNFWSKIIMTFQIELSLNIFHANELKLIHTAHTSLEFINSPNGADWWIKADRFSYICYTFRSTTEKPLKWISFGFSAQATDRIGTIDFSDILFKSHTTTHKIITQC